MSSWRSEFWVVNSVGSSSRSAETAERRASACLMAWMLWRIHYIHGEGVGGTKGSCACSR